MRISAFLSALQRIRSEHVDLTWPRKRRWGSLGSGTLIRSWCRDRVVRFGGVLDGETVVLICGREAFVPSSTSHRRAHRR